jgi:hypothetical protein
MARARLGSGIGLNGSMTPKPTDGIVLAGYVPAMPIARAAWQSAAFVPAEFMTISGCFTDGLARPEFFAWHVDRGDAERAAQGECPASVGLLAAGLVGDDVSVFLEDHDLRVAWPSSESRPEARPTPLDLVSAGAPLPPDAELLGFDVVGVDQGVFWIHSWLCHSYEARVSRDLDIRLDSRGLLDSYEKATRVLDWLEARSDEEAPEPAWWTVMAIALCRAT